MEDSQTTPNTNGNFRKPDGTFAVGNPGGPGRPVGSVSIVGKIKQKFQENPEYFQEWIDKLMEDPSNRRAIMEQIDGKPSQPIANADGEAFVIQVVQYAKNTDDTPQLSETN